MVKGLLLTLLSSIIAILQLQAQFTSVSFSIQAHADDWQLFMSSRIIADMNVAQRKMVFITLTAGDESCGACSYGGGGPFFLGRENGSVMSSKFAADLTTGTAPLDQPTATTVAINGHNITKYVYKNTVNYFLRLPDGNLDGNGFPNNNYQSLKRLRNGNISSISTIGINDFPPLAPTATYVGWSDLTNTVKAIINAEKITGTQSWIHTAHENTSYNINDHSDHTHAGLASTAAVSSGMTWVGVNGFMDYQSSAYSSPLLSDAEHTNASILFGLEVLGMTESQYQNDFSSGHQGWLPIDLFQVIRNPSGNAPFAGGSEAPVENGNFNQSGYQEIPMIITVHPAVINKDVKLGISPYESGELVTAVYDQLGNKVYELTTRVQNRDAFELVLKAPIKTKGVYLIKTILNNQYIETRKVVAQ